jgi:hypothetical protein
MRPDAPRVRRVVVAGRSAKVKSKLEAYRRGGTALRVMAATAIVAGVMARSAGALPMFTAGAESSCARCHDTMPHLNRAGCDYLRGGDRSAELASDHGSRAGTIPLSVIGVVGVSRSPGMPGRSFIQGSELSPRDRVGGAVWGRTVMPLSSRIAFHGEAGFDRAGAALSSHEAFLEWDRRPGTPGWSARAGWFSVEAPFLSAWRRALVQPFTSPVGLEARGVGFGYAQGGWNASTGLIESHRQQTGRSIDDRVFEHLQDSFLAIGLDDGRQQWFARMLFDRQDSTLPTLTWMQHLQAMGAGQFHAGRLTLIPAYVFDRFDDRPAAGVHDRHQYYVLEAFAPLDRGRQWTLGARLEHEYRTRTRYSPEEDHQLDVLDVARELGSLATLSLEWSRQTQNTGLPRSTALDLALRIHY